MKSLFAIHRVHRLTQTSMTTTCPCGLLKIAAGMAIASVLISTLALAQEGPSLDQSTVPGEVPLPLGTDSVQAVVQATVEGLVSSHAIVNHVLAGNHFEEGLGESHTSMDTSLRNNSGIVNVNQSSGSLNNQGNVRVLALANAEAVLQDVALSVSTVHRDNTVVLSGASRNNRIVNSFGDSSGIVGVNQSAGNLNLQANILALGLSGASGSDPTLFQLDDENLGEVNANNKVTGPLGSRSDVIANSFANFSGIAQVTQSSGDLNTVRNSIGISFSMAGQP